MLQLRCVCVRLKVSWLTLRTGVPWHCMCLQANLREFLKDCPHEPSLDILISPLQFEGLSSISAIRLCLQVRPARSPFGCPRSAPCPLETPLLLPNRTPPPCFPVVRATALRPAREENYFLLL